EPQVLDLAVLAGLHLARRAVGRGGEARVAETAAPPLRDQDPLPLLGEIRQQLQRLAVVLGLLVDEGADRHRQLEVVAVRARAVRPLAVAAPARREFGVESIVDEGVDVRAGDDVDRSAASTVAAARAAPRDALLAPERKAAAPSVPRLDVDVYFVNKHAV